MSQIRNAMCLCSSCSANSIGILFVHSWKNVPKSETNFWKQCIITEQWNTVMTQNFAHKIVHSSAMYYKNLIIIHECSKKLLRWKIAKVCLTPSTSTKFVCVFFLLLCFAVQSQPDRQQITWFKSPFSDMSEITIIKYFIFKACYVIYHMSQKKLQSDFPHQ